MSVEEKLRLVREATEPGMSVSLVARSHSLHPNQLSRGAVPLGASPALSSEACAALGFGALARWRAT